MMKSSRLPLVIILAPATYFGYHTIYRPAQRAVRALEQQLAEERKTQELRVQVARSLEEFKRLGKRLAPEPDPEWLVREINRLVETVGIYPPVSIVPQRPTKLRDFTSLVVAVQFDASYHRLGEFTSVLERSETFFHVDEVQIQREGKRPPSVRLTVSTLYGPPLTGGTPQ